MCVFLFISLKLFWGRVLWWCLLNLAWFSIAVLAPIVVMINHINKNQSILVTLSPLIGYLVLFPVWYGLGYPAIKDKIKWFFGNKKYNNSFLSTE